ncbi:MAG TPA: 50S ribosomal protein L25 [Thermoanaerobaculia bacterium]|nr:50S ribosomal protein L25 [Thermoanaerobaculia bacterium]
MSEMTIEVQKRERVGKGGNREARRNGLIPGVVYGGGKDSVPIQLDRKSFVEMMKKSDSENPIFLLKLGTGQERHAILREIQKDPVSRMVIHLDFQRVDMNQKVHVTVPIELKGTAYGVKTEGGLIDFVTREIAVECLPGNIPAHLDLDVTEVRVGQHVEARELQLPEGVTLFDAPEKVILSLTHARAEEATEGGDRAEPEVIKRGKGEEV